MKKIAFVGNGEPPSRLLEIFKKQTPGRSGIWGNLQGVDNYAEADYFMVIDWLPSGLGIDESKCIFLGAHPETLRAYRDMSNYKGFKMFDCKNTFGFGEWWLKYDYDFLKALQPPNKTKRLACIMSNAESDSSHITRKTWLSKFTRNSDLDFSLYGRILNRKSYEIPNYDKYYKGACGSLDPRGAAASGGNDHMSGKEDVYLEHKFMIEFDNVGSHYFSERVFDCLLMWAMPIYYGGKKLHEYLPEKSFAYLDIEKNGSDVIELSKSNFYEEHLNDIANARQLLLDKYQLWPRLHEAIFGVTK